MHKKKLGSRPVTWTGGSLLAALSKWVDFKLQPLTTFYPSYICDWEDLTTKLKELGPLPSSAKLFAIDATLIFTNININHGLEVLQMWLDKLQEESKIPLTFPINCDGVNRNYNEK